MTTCCFGTSIDVISLRGRLNRAVGTQRTGFTNIVGIRKGLRPIAFRAGYGIMSSFTTEGGNMFLKALLFLGVVTLVTSCSSVPLCGDREFTFEVPSTIPFVSGAFTIKRSSDHVDCERDPEERALPNG